MPAGLQAFQSKNDVNAMCGGIARDLNQLFVRLEEVQLFLLATDLTSAPYSMDPGDQTILKSAMTDLDQLRQVYQGIATRDPAYDYRTFAKQIFGLGIT